MAKKESYEAREKKAKEYVKKNLIRQIAKQKVYELGIIPLLVAFLWFVPYWLGLLAVKIIGTENYLNFLNNVGETSALFITRVQYWFLGFVALALLIIFIIINFGIAREILEAKANKKFDIPRYDL